MLKDIPINPGFSPSLRCDLEFYIPQLVNYMVFFKALGNTDMNHFMLSLVSLNYFFGHLLYWNLNSYSKIYRLSQEQTLPQIPAILQLLLEQANTTYQDRKCTAATQLALSSGKERLRIQGYLEQSVHSQGLQEYQSIYSSEANPSSFMSTILFYRDLIQISEELAAFKKKSSSQKTLFV